MARQLARVGATDEANQAFQRFTTQEHGALHKAAALPAPFTHLASSRKPRDRPFFRGRVLDGFAGCSGATMPARSTSFDDGHARSAGHRSGRQSGAQSVPRWPFRDGRSTRARASSVAIESRPIDRAASHRRARAPGQSRARRRGRGTERAVRLNRERAGAPRAGRRADRSDTLKRQAGLGETPLRFRLGPRRYMLAWLSAARLYADRGP